VAAQPDEEFATYAGPGASPGRSGRFLKKEPWQLRPDETVLTRSEPFFRKYYIFWAVISPLLLLAPLLLIAGNWIVIRLRRPEWILTDRRVIKVEGWLTRNATSIALDKINEVHYRRTFMERVFYGQGSILIESAATAGMTSLSNAADDDPFRHALEAQVEKRRPL
jgi:uncharacterized membrane protein YdbT with pleckstrin-like domain